MTTEPLSDAVARVLAGQISRRTFMARALALGLSTSAAASLLAACGNVASSASATKPPKLPEIVPDPLKVTYGALTGLGDLTCCACPEGNLRDRLAEIADRAHIALRFDVCADAASTSRLRVTLDADGVPAQGYRLTVTDADRLAAIRVQATDEAGAFYGLESLAQLVIRDGSTISVRQATVADQPSFERRGAIIDPPQLERLRFGVPFKMNFLALASGMPPDVGALLDYARSHYVEVMSMVGYRDLLSTVPIADLKGFLSSQFQIGIRSFCLKWDDIGVSDAVEATTHAAIFAELYAHLRSLDPTVKVSIVMPPYGGVPGANLFFGDAGRHYLALMKERLPADVVVFWTGDGGVFSETVTAGGAEAYASLVGHPIGLWDNNALWFVNGRRPLWGRAADLPMVIGTYMANMVDRELASKGTAGQVALLTELQYAWRAETYEPMAACAAAEQILRADGQWAAPESTCAPPAPIGTARPIELPSPTRGPAG